ncbi:nucleoside 2-deoxyribosyltransferase domain-containing protein [Paraflavitalea pollutisoli]|uniref:nucleoside 2-deoxyribosyltransferase domain-containing protein n=1 Tax=Paraflavitalea pollutisoli TaxID=3034143 RepID=UPI0023EAA2FB|nr:nucleoside 2-deoxyribosyltransferase domain-containing protein [Paraflavitalea sp. H1-2-19X]
MSISVVMPPQPVESGHRVTVFLAGSIEMGTAVDWQTQAIALFNALLPAEVQEDWLLLNPRRPDWDASWKQDRADPQFYGQVSWELDGLRRADHVLVYFDPATKAPVSLLELGAFHQKAVVVCPDGFWRKGNVDIFCEQFGVQQIKDLAAAVEYIVQQCQ